MLKALLFHAVFLGRISPCCLKILHCFRVGTFFPLHDRYGSMNTVMVSKLFEVDYDYYPVNSKEDIQTLLKLENLKFLPEATTNAEKCVPAELKELLIRILRENIYNKFIYEGREKNTKHPKFRMVRTEEDTPTLDVIPRCIKNPFKDDEMLYKVCCCTGLYSSRILCGITAPCYLLELLGTGPSMPFAATFTSCASCTCLSFAVYSNQDLLEDASKGWMRILTYALCGPEWLLSNGSETME